MVAGAAVALVFAATCSCSGVGHMPSKKEAADDFEDFKVRTGLVGEKAAEASKGLGLKHNHDAKGTAKSTSEMAGDAAKNAKEKVQDMASG